MDYKHSISNVITGFTFCVLLQFFVTSLYSQPLLAAGNPFIGSWKLVSWKHKKTDGSISYPMGQTPVGLLIYDRPDNISVQIMDDFRPTFDAGFEQTTLEELKTVYNSYMALFGRYSVDATSKSITIEVRGITNPNYLTSSLTRYYDLNGNILALSLDKQGNNQTLWERMPGH